MIEIYKSEDGKIIKQHDIMEGCWVSLTTPTESEINQISELTGIAPEDLRAPMDEEERSRIEYEKDYSMILVDIPVLEKHNNKDRYVTIPLGIYLTKECIITCCLESSPILEAFAKGNVKDFHTFKKTRFIYQMLYNNATTYLRCLRIIDRKSEEIEEKLHISQKNRELIELLELEKSMVYFTTSLRANEVVLERLLKTDKIKQYPEDAELLEDVIVENKQAIEMANIYSGILSGMTSAFASVISNNLNIVMKFLATITIVLSIPTMIASFFGMNFTNIPLSNEPYGFYLTVGLTLVLTGTIALLFAKKNLF